MKSISFILSVLAVPAVLMWYIISAGWMAPTAQPATESTERSTLQQNQRDTQRKQDVQTIIVDIQNYTISHRLQLPEIQELSTEKLGQIKSITKDEKPTKDKAVFKTGLRCDGTKASSRAYTVSILLENGSTYCLD